MTQLNDLAFPLAIPEHVSAGLTKHEWMATKLMAALLSNPAITSSLPSDKMLRLLANSANKATREIARFSD